MRFEEGLREVILSFLNMLSIRRSFAIFQCESYERLLLTAK